MFGTDDSAAQQAAARPPGRIGPVGWIVFTLGLIALGCMGVDVIYREVPPAPPRPVRYARVRLGQLPRWMPSDVAGGIQADLQKCARGRLLTDENLAQDVYRAGGGNPWVGRVDKVVKYRDGTVLVQAAYRRPFALVGSAQLQSPDLRVVDAQGVVLPMAAGRLNARTFVAIRGVASGPPQPGAKWDAPDLRDGLRLLHLIKNRPYVAEITTIDVRNHAGLIPTEPEIRLKAQNAEGAVTDIRFGRFPAADGLDPGITPARRIEYLDAYARSNGGRLAGTRAFVDLRYDTLYVSLR